MYSWTSTLSFQAQGVNATSLYPLYMFCSLLSLDHPEQLESFQSLGLQG